MIAVFCSPSATQYTEAEVKACMVSNLDFLSTYSTLYYFELVLPEHPRKNLCIKLEGILKRPETNLISFEHIFSSLLQHFLFSAAVRPELLEVCIFQFTFRKLSFANFCMLNLLKQQVTKTYLFFHT